MIHFFIYLSLAIVILSPNSFAGYEKEIKAVASSSQTVEEKVGQILEIIKQPDCDDPCIGFQEIVNLVPPYSPLLSKAFTDQGIKYETRAQSLIQIFSSSLDYSRNFHLFQSVIKENPQAFYSIERLQKTPQAFFEFLIRTPLFMNVSLYDLLPDDDRFDVYSKLLKSDLDVEKRLSILTYLIEQGGPYERYTPSQIKVAVFNEFFPLWEQYGDSKAPTSHPVLTEQDHIQRFWVEYIIPRIPEVIREELLKCKLKGRIFLAKKWHDSQEDSSVCPAELIQFHREVATSQDDQVTDTDRFNACRYLSMYSENDAVPLILNILGTDESSYSSLKEPYVQLARLSSDEGLKKKGEEFVKTYQSEIKKAAQEKYNRLPLHSRMSIPDLHDKNSTGDKVTIAVLDVGFFKILPPDFWPSGQDELRTFKKYSDEKTLQWLSLHEEKILPPKVFNKEGLLRENRFGPCHGSKMVDLIATIAQEAYILPVLADQSSWVAAFNDLAEDPDVNIISISQGLPKGFSDISVSSDLKESIMRCLKNNKIIVLSAGNSGMTIPVIPAWPECPAGRSRKCITEYDSYLWSRGDEYCPSRISSLFEGESETSLLFSQFIIGGSSKAGSFEVHEKSDKSGEGPAQKCYVYVDADELMGFFDDQPRWGGTSSATAMISGFAGKLWGHTKKDDLTAARVGRAIFEGTDVDEALPSNVRGRGKVNPSKSFKKMGELSEDISL